MTKMKLNITPTLMTKLNILSSEYNIEFGGYLTGEIKDNEIHLKDLLIPNQTISSASVSITGEAQVELRKKYGDKVKNIIGHWHSHHSLGCFWSNTDETDMANVMSMKKFFVWIVSSNGEHLIRVSQRDPFGFDFNDCEFYIKSVRMENLRRKADALLSENRFESTVPPAIEDNTEDDNINDDETDGGQSYLQ